MSNDQASSEGRGGRTAGNGVSVSTTLSVIVAAIAVLLGFLILRDVNRDRGDAGVPDPTDETTTLPIDPSGSSIPTDTTTLPRTGFKVMVANASGVTGSAGQMSTALQAQQFIVTQPTNAAETVGKQTATKVYYVAGYESGAAAVAQVLGGVPIEAVPTPPPVETGDLGEATVLVLLGTDLAGKLLPGALPTAPTDTTTTLAPA
ncbi:MAG: LytR C-terminal domain-containing protein [Acidimicrobiia bacterium]